VGNHFRVGNSGDIFARDIIHCEYGVKSLNIKNQDSRLLCVGSIAHRIRRDDIICGIGTKGLPVPGANKERCTIFGLRGPITYDAFKKAGYDMSKLRFLKDPGLLLRFICGQDKTRPSPSKVIFIPHYRERAMHKQLPRGIEFVDVDLRPHQLAKEIAKASLVYSSSLHGMIFAHALNRPCVLVRPQTDEPLVKYEDYCASVDIPFIKPLASIYDASFLNSPDSPPDLKYAREDFYFPSIELLAERGILV